MYLKYQLGVKSFFVQFAADAEHCKLYNIRRTALDRAVHGNALTEFALYRVVSRNFRDVSAPAEQCGDISARTRFGYDVLEVRVYLRIGGKIAVDICARLLYGNTEISGEGEIPYSVNYTEIHRFGALAQLRSDIFG